MGPDAMILLFWMLSFKPGFSLSSSPRSYFHMWLSRCLEWSSYLLQLAQVSLSSPNPSVLRKISLLSHQVDFMCALSLSCLTLCNPMGCRVGCHALLQGIFPTQGTKLGLRRLLHQAGSLLLPLGKPNKVDFAYVHTKLFQSCLWPHWRQSES